MHNYCQCCKVVYEIFYPKGILAACPKCKAKLVEFPGAGINNCHGCDGIEAYFIDSRDGRVLCANCIG